MIPSLLLFCSNDAPAIMMAPLANFSLQLIVETPSLLLFCIKDSPAIMTFSLQLIVESLFLLCDKANSEITISSLLLLCNFKCPSITTVSNDNFSFKFIVESLSEGARFVPNFDWPGNFDSSKLTVIFRSTSFHFREDYRIFCEGEYQYQKNCH